ncbi:MAG: DUF167 domain-containing protein [Carbonactinosporaceae bacterium]
MTARVRSTAARVAVRVRPGASHPAVGGTYGDLLVVRVSAPAVGGKATGAALDALAVALGVPRRSVRLASGATSRTKIITVDEPPPDLEQRISRLKDGA